MKEFIMTWLLGALVVFGAAVCVAGLFIVVASFTITPEVLIPVGMLAGSLVSSLGVMLSVYILDNYLS